MTTTSSLRKRLAEADQLAATARYPDAVAARDLYAQALRLAQETFDIEAAAVLGLKARTGDAFVQAVRLMLEVRGRVVVMGMGKSGHIGRKIAATLASTGTPAMFVHPAEASHGDLGMIKAIDIVLAISNGGESQEITVILPVLKRLGVYDPQAAAFLRADTLTAANAMLVAAQNAIPLAHEWGGGEVASVRPVPGGAEAISFGRNATEHRAGRAGVLPAPSLHRRQRR